MQRAEGGSVPWRGDADGWHAHRHRRRTGSAESRIRHSWVRKAIQHMDGMNVSYGPETWVYVRNDERIPWHDERQDGRPSAHDV